MDGAGVSLIGTFLLVILLVTVLINALINLQLAIKF